MSYKNYSVEAVKEIMQKVVESQNSDHEDTFTTADGLTLDELIKVGEEVGLDTKEIRDAAYDYNHPATINKSGLNNTHIFIEKAFEAELSKKRTWEGIVDELELFFVEESSGKINHQPESMRWVYVNHTNHETVVSLTMRDTHAKLKLSQRVGFFSPLTEGLLHGSYISLILFGFIFYTYQLTLAFPIITLGLLWSVVAVLIYGLSVSSRKRKLKRLKNLVDRLIDNLPSVHEIPSR